MTDQRDNAEQQETASVTAGTLVLQHSYTSLVPVYVSNVAKLARPQDYSSSEAGRWTH